MPPATDLHALALQYLKRALGPQAEFRDGQWEAIDALVTRNARMLVVQRTGWGKSLVYFLTTRLLRDRGAGPTLLVSPLLALMRNQIEAAGKLGIRPVTINSTNRGDWDSVGQQVRDNAVDVILVSPERLSHEGFQRDVLTPLAARAGLFVVDEAHCISDWGHDFRPDYRRITALLQRLPANIPVCATTATANSRVVEDILHQLGPMLELSRGPLVRHSLRLQTVPLADSAAKLAWLARHLPRFEGSGIVYALTVRWSERIAEWLGKKGIVARAYHASLPPEERLEREELLQANRIKALVATTALGMGYDKADLGFVVHFGQPTSVVHYYQQVGRAGRAIDKAYGVMLSGGDDREIGDYFIEGAFPPEAQLSRVLEHLEASEQGMTLNELQAAVNITHDGLERLLKTLACESPAPVVKVESRWAVTAERYDMERRRQLVARLTERRRQEQQQMDAYGKHRGCLMEFLARALDDPTAAPCGLCAPCKNQHDALRDVPEELRLQALAFLGQAHVPIEPRKQWQAGAHGNPAWKGRIAAELQMETGRALCILNDPGLGELVLAGKYQTGTFDPKLVASLADMVRHWKPVPPPTWVTCVPSQSHPGLVPDLASNLAERLGLPFVAAVAKVGSNQPQKKMANSWQQAHNLTGVFRVTARPPMAGPVLLVDDIVDSRWTLTVVSALLREAGSGPVFPIALAANR